jgi:MFS family permease
MGFLLTAPMLVLLRLVDKNNTVHQALLALILLLIGLFLSTVEVAMMSEMACVVASLQEANPAFFGNMGGMVHGYGLFNVAVAGGQLIGPLVGGFVRQELGWNAMSLLLASLSLLAVVPTALWTGGWIGNMEGGKESYIGDNGEDI